MATNNQSNLTNPALPNQSGSVSGPGLDQEDLRATIARLSEQLQTLTEQVRNHQQPPSPRPPVEPNQTPPVQRNQHPAAGIIPPGSLSATTSPRLRDHSVHFPEPPSSEGVDLKWRPGDIGYFQPDLDESYGSGDCATVGQATYWRNVYLFTENVHANAIGERAPIVRMNLHTCLRGIAQNWYTGELGPLERDGLRFNPNGVDAWVQALQKRFKDHPAVAVQKMQAERYTANDARNDRSMRSYVASILRHAQAAEFDKPIQQLVHAWNNLDPAIRPFITRPTTDTTVSQFMDEVDAKQDAIRGMLQAQHRSFVGNNIRRGNEPAKNFRPFRPQSSLSPSQYQPLNSFRPFRPYSGQSGARFNNFKPYFPFSQGVQVNQVKQTNPPHQGKPKLAITAGDQQGPSNQAQGQNARSDSDNRSKQAQPWRYRRFRRYDGANFSQDDFYDVDCNLGTQYDQQLEENGYVASEEVYFSQDPSNDTADTDEVDSVPEEDDQAMLAVSKPEPRTTRCQKCNRTFTSRNQMFKHIYTNNCIQPDRSQRIASTTFHQPQIVKAVIDTNQQQQAYTYITLKVRLSLNGPDYEVCADTGCSRPLVDREWLKNHTYTMDRSKSTTVRGIGTLKLSE
jgi:hypothetical protein